MILLTDTISPGDSGMRGVGFDGSFERHGLLFAFPKIHAEHYGTGNFPIVWENIPRWPF